MKIRDTKRILINYAQFRMIREVLKHRNIYYLAGSASIYVPSRREKYIISHNHLNQPIAREWPNLDGEMVWMTPGEAARTELEREYGNIKKIGWPGKSVTLLDWRWPMVFTGTFEGEGVYTDLSGAYNQCYRRLWLDTCFPRGRGTLPLGRIAERLSQWKLARNSLIGIVRSREGTGYRGSVRYTLKMGNKFLSPHLWATVQGWLNEIAFYAIRTGGVYVNTDGYIHPVSSDVVAFQRWLSNSGVTYTTLAGACHIRGWGNYRVGGRATKNYTNNRNWTTAPFNTICLPDNRTPTKIFDWWRGLGDEK